MLKRFAARDLCDGARRATAHLADRDAGRSGRGGGRRRGDRGERGPRAFAAAQHGVGDRPEQQHADGDQDGQHPPVEEIGAERLEKVVDRAHGVTTAGVVGEVVAGVVLGAAVLGEVADWTSIEFVYRICSFLPAIGLLAAFLPDIEGRTRVAKAE